MEFCRSFFRCKMPKALVDATVIYWVFLHVLPSLSSARLLCTKRNVCLTPFSLFTTHRQLDPYWSAILRKHPVRLSNVRRTWACPIFQRACTRQTHQWNALQLIHQGGIVVHCCLIFPIKCIFFQRTFFRDSSSVHMITASKQSAHVVPRLTVGHDLFHRSRMLNQSLLSQSFIKFNYMLFAQFCVQAIYGLITATRCWKNGNNEANGNISCVRMGMCVCQSIFLVERKIF